jgi:hypothetical protein
MEPSMEPAYYVQTQNVLDNNIIIPPLNHHKGLFIESGIVENVLKIKPIYVKRKLSGFTINEDRPIPESILLEAYHNQNNPGNESLKIVKRSLCAARFLPQDIIIEICDLINDKYIRDEYLFRFEPSTILRQFKPQWDRLKIRRTDQYHIYNRMVGTKFVDLVQNMSRSTHSRSPAYTQRIWSPRDLESVQSYGPPPGLQRKGYSMWNGPDIGKDVRLHSKGYSMWNGRDIGKDVRDPVGMDDIDSQEHMVAYLVDEDIRGGKRKSKKRRSSKKSNTKKVKRKSHKKK